MSGTPDSVVQDDTTEVLAAETAVAALEHGPRGALVISALSVGLLLVGWLLFYFCLFLKRGAIG